MRVSQFAALLAEHAEYNHDYGEYPIVEIVRDDHHEYAGAGGITYELGTGENMILGVDEIEATPGNTLYENQIDSYIKYIENGGELESFPVQACEDTLSRKVFLLDLRKMCQRRV